MSAIFMPQGTGKFAASLLEFDSLALLKSLTKTHDGISEYFLTLGSYDD